MCTLDGCNCNPTDNEEEVCEKFSGEKLGCPRCCKTTKCFNGTFDSSAVGGSNTMPLGDEYVASHAPTSHPVTRYPTIAPTLGEADYPSEGPFISEISFNADGSCSYIELYSPNGTNANDEYAIMYGDTLIGEPSGYSVNYMESDKSVFDKIDGEDSVRKVGVLNALNNDCDTMGNDHIFLPDPDAKLSCQQKIYHYMLPQLPSYPTDNANKIQIVNERIRNFVEPVLSPILNGSLTPVQKFAVIKALFPYFSFATLNPGNTDGQLEFLPDTAGIMWIWKATIPTIKLVKKIAECMQDTVKEFPGSIQTLGDLDHEFLHRWCTKSGIYTFTPDPSISPMQINLEPKKAFILQYSSSDLINSSKPDSKPDTLKDVPRNRPPFRTPFEKLHNMPSEEDRVWK